MPRLSPEQLQRRRSFLGSSDVAAICGLDRYRTGLDVWLEKRGATEPAEESEAALMGHLLEPVVAQRYELANEGVTLIPVNEEVVGPMPFLAATLDYRAVSDTREWIVEVKTRSRFSMREWGEAGTDKVSPAVLCQVLWQQAISGLTNMAEVAVLVDGREFRLYSVQHDAEVAADLMQIASDWYERHMVRGEEPPLDGGQVAAYLQQKYKQALSKEVVAASEHGAQLLAEYAIVSEKLKQLKQRQDELKQAAMLEIRDGYGIESEAGKMLWLNAKGRTTTDYAAIVKELQVPEDVLQRHTRIGAPSRQMRFYPKEASHDND
jgi:putative phage-type endonuclease